MKKIYNYGLVEGRHSIPQVTDGFIFTESIADPTDLGAMGDIAVKKIDTDATMINLYVTGLTVALVVVINVCLGYGIPLMLWHFDAKTGGYFKQSLVSFQRILPLE